MDRFPGRRSRLAGAAVAVLAAGGVIAGCSSSSSTSSAPGTSTNTSSAAPATSSTAVATSSCGTKPGVAASGTPINLGSIVTDSPAANFTDIANMAQAYFNCVNANGGINGHPIKYGWPLMPPFAFTQLK